MSEYDTTELVPKVDSQVLEFLNQHPEYDGKDVVVAILDTGNDALSNGLLVCPDGSPKYLDFIDATGSGDVDTSVIAESFEEKGEKYLVGLSGRKFKLGSQFNSTDGKFHLGLKRAYDLFPKPLVERLQKLNSERASLLSGSIEGVLREELSAAKDPKDVADIEAKLAYLKKASVGSVGPVIDCIVWNDGTLDCAVLSYDNEFEVDLSNAVVYNAFKVKQDVIRFDEESNLAITLNFYDDLNVLSIVVPAGSHGTHVAGIVAAHHPDDPKRNGQAPGAKLVSIKIGDTHLGSMETSTGVTRALLACEEWKVDVANMSYGEYSLMPDKGRFPEAMKKLIQKGMVFVTSAGNSGPCLSTMGAPGCDGNGITVGAYLTPDIVDPLYSFVTKPERSNYFWSSRGPSMNGDPVTVSGLGAAITAVPSYTLTPTKLMNGTSMASPNVCGIVALLMSGMKARGLKYTPEAIKLALQNTALPGKCPHASGSGYVQLVEAFNQLQLHNTNLIGCDVKVTGTDTVNISQRAIYLCQQQQTSRKHLFNVTVTPKLDVASTIVPTRSSVYEYSKEEITALEMLCVVECDAKWVKVPKTVAITSEGKALQVYVDPTVLAQNSVNHANIVIRVADTDIVTAVIPVTVVVPNTSNNALVTKLQPGIPQSCIFEVPRTAQNVVLRLKTTDAKFRNQMIDVSTVQLLQQLNHKTTATGTSVMLTYDEDTVINVNAQAGSVMQVCITRPWSRPEPCDVKLEFDWQGVATNGATHTTLSFNGLNKYEALVFETQKRCIQAPQAKFSTLTKTVQPSKAFIEKLSVRDTLLTGVSNYRLTLEYAFKLSAATKITPELSTTYGLLYEQYLDGQRIHIFNGNNKLVHMSDAFPRESQLLEAGAYTARVEFKHNDVSVLEQIKVTTLNYSQALKTAVTATVLQAIGSSDTLNTPLHAGEVVRGFLSLPNSGVTGANDGDVLSGSLTAIKGKTCSTPVTMVYRSTDKSVTTTKTGPPKFQDAYIAQQKPTPASAVIVDIGEARVDMMKAFLGSVTPDKALPVFTALVEDTFIQNVNGSVATDKSTVAFAGSVLAALLRATQIEQSSESLIKIKTIADIVLTRVVNEAELALFMLKELSTTADDKSQQDKKDALSVLHQAYLLQALVTILQNEDPTEAINICKVMHKANEGLCAAFEVLHSIRNRKYGAALAALEKTESKNEQEVLLKAAKSELLASTALPSQLAQLPVKTQVETLLSKIIFGETFEKLTLNQLLVNNALAIEPFM